MASLADVMVGLSDAIGAATTLNVYDAPYDSPTFPAAIVLWPETIDVETFLGAGDALTEATIIIPVMVAAQATNSLDEARALREVVPDVINAIHADSDLGLTGVDCSCTTVADFGRTQFGEAFASTATIAVEVLMS
jgi:hypothetical protein